MRWIVRVARSMDDVIECHFTDKNKALEQVESGYKNSKMAFCIENRT